MRTGFLFLFGAAAAVTGTLGCSTGEPDEAASVPPDSGAGNLSASDAGDPSQKRVPVSRYEPELPEEGQFCALLAAVECDGSEDCPEGQTCCGNLNGGSLSYESIRCQDRCDLAEGGRTICHEQDTCPDPEESCIRSIILPSYLGICGTPTAFTPVGFEAAGTAPGEINCAPGLACTGGKVCCSLTSWDAETQSALFIDGRCVDEPEDCSCSAGTPEPITLPPGVDAGDAENDDGGLQGEGGR